MPAPSAQRFVSYMRRTPCSYSSSYALSLSTLSTPHPHYPPLITLPSPHPLYPLSRSPLPSPQPSPPPHKAKPINPAPPQSAHGRTTPTTKVSMLILITSPLPPPSPLPLPHQTPPPKQQRTHLRDLPRQLLTLQPRPPYPSLSTHSSRPTHPSLPGYRPPIHPPPPPSYPRAHPRARVARGAVPVPPAAEEERPEGALEEGEEDLCRVEGGGEVSGVR